MQIGRNDPCPCGSGKKYKKCCGNVVRIDQLPEQRTSSRLIKELLDFVKKRYDDRVHEGWLQFWGDFDPEQLDQGLYDMSLQNFFEWVVHDLPVDDDGTTLIEDFMKSSRRLDSDELAVLSKMDESALSLYEVESLYPGKGLQMRDLLLGGSYYVHEKTASQYLNQWDLIAARLLNLDDIHIMSGAGYVVQRQLQQELTKSFKKELTALRRRRSGFTMKDLLKRKGWMFNAWWYEPIKRMEDLTMVTADGDLLTLSTAIYGASDPGEVVMKLSDLDDFELDGNTFVWLGEEQKTGGWRMLGTIKLDGDEVKLETNSKERLAIGRGLLERNLGSLLAHKLDTFQDARQAVEHSSALPRTNEELPPEVKQQAYEQFMGMYYEQWLSDSIPMLNKKTPLEAVADKRLRRVVVSMIKDLENAEEKNRQQGRPFFDVSWMRERLGLRPDEF